MGGDDLKGVRGRGDLKAQSEWESKGTVWGGGGSQGGLNTVCGSGDGGIKGTGEGSKGTILEGDPKARTVVPEGQSERRDHETLWREDLKE